MPWMALAGAAISAAPGLIGGSKGANGPRNIQFENVSSDPWAVQSYQDTHQALQQQQNFVNALQQQGGIGNQSSVFAQQQALANQLGQQAMGQGPNPAQAQLANTTGQNVNQQAALMAGQRGASSNVGMMARNIGQQGANIQQQAAGQGAALSAQQQIAAQQALMQQQAQMSNLATNQVGQQANAQNSMQQAAQNLYATQSNNINNWNSANVTAATGASTNASAMNLQQDAQQNKALAGGAAGLGKAVQLFGQQQAAPVEDATQNFDKDGEGRAYGGMIAGPKSSAAKRLKSLNMKSGGPVPGKAPVKGDSKKNDTVPAMLSPGEVVIPRSVLSSKNPGDAAKKFVQAVMAGKK